MQFKDLEWKNIISNGVIVCSTYKLNLCGWIRIEFKINHEPEEDKYMLYSFGKGSIRRLELKSMVQLNRQKMRHIEYIVMRWRGSEKQLIIW